MVDPEQHDPQPGVDQGDGSCSMNRTPVSIGLVERGSQDRETTCERNQAFDLPYGARAPASDGRPETAGSAAGRPNLTARLLGSLFHREFYRNRKRNSHLRPGEI